jgi:Trypsin
LPLTAPTAGPLSPTKFVRFSWRAAVACAIFGVGAARAQAEEPPICSVCPCEATAASRRDDPLGVGFVIDRSTSMLGLARREQAARGNALDAIASRLEGVASREVPDLRAHGRRVVATLPVTGTRSNHSPISWQLEAAAGADALVVITDDLEDNQADIDCKSARPLARRCECERLRLVGAMRKVLASGTNLFWVSVPPSPGADECQASAAEAERAVVAVCRGAPLGQGGGFCHHRSLRARDLRRGALSAALPGLDDDFASFLNDVMRRRRESAPKVPVEPPPPSALLLGDDRRWKCSAVPIAPDAVLSAAHCLPATRVLDEDDMTHELRSLAVTASARAPDPRADAALFRVKASELLRVPSRRHASDDAPPIGVLRLVGYGDHVYAGGSPFGRRSSLDLPASGWGCDGRRVDQTGCWPGLEMVLVGSLGRDSCFGDSGGPLYELIGDGARCDWRLVAITSRSLGGGYEACGSGGLYTRADALDAWIDRTLASWKQTPP